MQNCMFVKGENPYHTHTHTHKHTTVNLSFIDSMPIAFIKNGASVAPNSDVFGATNHFRTIQWGGNIRTPRQFCTVLTEFSISLRSEGNSLRGFWCQSNDCVSKHFTSKEVIRPTHTTEVCALLGYYAASCGECLPTFRDSVLVPSSRVKGPRRNTSGERTTRQHHGGSLKSSVTTQ
jgi:hypothetical protein